MEKEKIEVVCSNCGRVFAIDQEELGQARCNWCETDNLLEEE